ncbi:MAG: DUF3078 domain-containing protein [Bernardetiaceae bacterium]|nr:DUF3078 domain-containing protein [Bernardetiaceae bacterium]
MILQERFLLFISLVLIFFVAVQGLQAQEDVLRDTVIKYEVRIDTIRIDTSIVEKPRVQWERALITNMSFANVGLSNWQGGGENSLSIGGLIDGKLVRTTPKSIWTNSLNAALGMARVGGRERIFKKTDDQLVAQSTYSYRTKNNWNITTAAEFRTQNAPGHTFAVNDEGQEIRAATISRFLAPGYIRADIGAEYKNKWFSIRLSPLGNRTTLVLDDSLSSAGAFGVEEGERIRMDWGANLQNHIDLKIMENVRLKSNLNLFAAYDTIDKVVVNWDTILSLKVNDYISTSFATQMFYDHNVLIPLEDGSTTRALQFKHVLNLNFGYTF